MSCTDGDGNVDMRGMFHRLMTISRELGIDELIKRDIPENEPFPDLDSPSLIGKLYEMGMNHFNRKQRDNESTSAFILKYIASLEGRYIEESFPDLDSSCGE